MIIPAHSVVTAAADKVIYHDANEVSWLLGGKISLGDWFLRASLVKSDKKISAAALAEKSVFIKQYKTVGLLQQLCLLLGFGRARRVFEISVRLQEAGVPVAKPIVYGRKNSLLAHESYFACSLLSEGCIDIKTFYFSQQWQLLDKVDLLISIAKGLAVTAGGSGSFTAVRGVPVSAVQRAG